MKKILVILILFSCSAFGMQQQEEPKSAHLATILLKYKKAEDWPMFKEFTDLVNADKSPLISEAFGQPVDSYCTSHPQDSSVQRINRWIELVIYSRVFSPEGKRPIPNDLPEFHFVLIGQEFPHPTITTKVSHSGLRHHLDKILLQDQQEIEKKISLLHSNN